MLQNVRNNLVYPPPPRYTLASLPQKPTEPNFTVDHTSESP